MRVRGLEAELSAIEAPYLSKKWTGALLIFPRAARQDIFLMKEMGVNFTGAPWSTGSFHGLVAQMVRCFLKNFTSRSIRSWRSGVRSGGFWRSASS